MKPALQNLLHRYRDLKERVLAPGTRRRALYDALTWAVRRRIEAVTGHQEPIIEPYDRWRWTHVPKDSDLAALRAVDTRSWPRITVVVLGRADKAALRRTEASLAAQIYPRWELRVGASLAALTSELVAFADAGDALAPDALFRVAQRVAERGDDVVYTDEDRVDDAGVHRDPFFKPDWSPDLLMSMDYIGNLMVARRSLIEAVGGLRASLDGSERYDLMLRLAERTKRIAHLPHVLYHARRVHEEQARSALRALSEAATRRGFPAEVTRTQPGRYRVRYAIAGNPRVSIIIPTRDKWEVLKVAIDSIEAHSTYSNYELIIVDNGSSAPASLAYLEELGQRHRVVRDPTSPFNWSTINNRAARATDSPLLLFLNNDVEVITPNWIEAMIEHAQRPEVGPVGAKLFFPDGKVQHAGVIMGLCGTATHAFRGYVADGQEYFAMASVVRNFSAVTGACLMVRRELFDELGGFDEALRVAYNDVDFCLRAGVRGYASVYTPFAQLFHYESATRGSEHPLENEALLVSRWQALIDADPYFSPNLTLTAEDFRVDG
jgi:GT2 family glycosyltransferase